MRKFSLLKEHTPSLSFHPEIAPLRVHTPVHGFGTVDALWRKKFLLVGRWKINRRLWMQIRLWMLIWRRSHLSSPLLRLSDEHLQLIFEMRQKLDDQAHIQRILGQ
jgi:hypothetical protein